MIDAQPYKARNTPALLLWWRRVCRDYRSSVTHFEGPGANGLDAVTFFVTGISLEAGADAVILTLTVVDLP